MSGGQTRIRDRERRDGSVRLQRERAAKSGVGLCSSVPNSSMKPEQADSDARAQHAAS